LFSKAFLPPPKKFPFLILVSHINRKSKNWIRYITRILNYTTKINTTWSSGYYFVKLQKTIEGVEHETNMGLKKCIYFKVLEEL
jgi:hypothetical protein